VKHVTAWQLAQRLATIGNGSNLAHTDRTFLRRVVHAVFQLSQRAELPDGLKPGGHLLLTEVAGAQPSHECLRHGRGDGAHDQHDAQEENPILQRHVHGGCTGGSVRDNGQPDGGVNVSGGIPN
jgi:hypothetical protein